MPNIILKKTFKIKPSGFQVKAEKSFSFHGQVSADMITAVNQRLGALQLAKSSNRLHFNMDPFRHYFAEMNHDFQKYHEEDAVVAILDVMEILGWTFKFQYDSSSQSVQMGGSSSTARELFIFTKS
jgi:hypothetical protein